MPSATGRQFHAACMQYARWLVAISVIRAFLNYFLDRD